MRLSFLIQAVLIALKKSLSSILISFYTNLEWPGFGKQRQLAQDYVESDFVLWLDADERVTDELHQDILTAISQHCDKNIYRVNRLTTAFAKEIRYSGWSPDWVVRLYKTSETKYNDALVHESVVIPDGFKVVSLNGRLKHFTYEKLGEYTRKKPNCICNLGQTNVKVKNQPHFLVHLPMASSVSSKCILLNVAS